MVKKLLILTLAVMLAGCEKRDLSHHIVGEWNVKSSIYTDYSSVTGLFHKNGKYSMNYMNVDSTLFEETGLYWVDDVLDEIYIQSPTVGGNMRKGDKMRVQVRWGYKGDMMIWSILDNHGVKREFTFYKL